MSFCFIFLFQGWVGLKAKLQVVWAGLGPIQSLRLPRLVGRLVGFLTVGGIYTVLGAANLNFVVHCPDGDGQDYGAVVLICYPGAGTCIDR